MDVKLEDLPYHHIFIVYINYKSMHIIQLTLNRGCEKSINQQTITAYLNTY